MDFNKIVKKLSKSSRNVFDLDDISEYVDPGFARGEEGKRDTYKLAYRLRSEGVLLGIRNGLYVRMPASEAGTKTGAYDELRAVEDAYWKIVKKLVTKKCGSEYVLGGPKSLEIRMRDFSIPDTLIVYTRNFRGNVTVSDRHSVVFKPAKTGAKTGRSNAFPIFFGFSESVPVDGEKFRIAGIEHALLDTLTVHKGIGETDEYVVNKFLSKYAKAVRREALGKLVSAKYLTAINRLRAISKERGFRDLYEKALDVVKREGGGCFVSF